MRATAEAMVGSNAEVTGAFIGIRGPRPGVEMFGGLAATVVLILTGSVWLAAPIAIAAFIGVARARRYYTVIRTNEEVLLIDNGRRSQPRAGANVTRLPPNSITVPDAEGDPAATVGYMGLWLQDEHQDEARRLAKLGRA